MAGGPGRPAASAGGVGGLALGRPDHAGAPRAHNRAGAHGADAARLGAIGGILSAGARTALGPRGSRSARSRQDLAAVRETGSVVWEPHFLGLLADAYVQDGQVGAWLATLDEALAAARGTGQRSVEAELYVSGRASSCGSRGHRRRRRKPGSSGPWTSPAVRRRDSSSCGPR
jgi:predicted ATPase